MLGTKTIFIIILILIGIIVFDNIKMRAYEREIARYEAMAVIADTKTKKIIQKSKENRKEINEKYENTIASLNNELDSLRNNSASILPPVPKPSRHPHAISFSRKELDRAIQGFRESLREIVKRGATCEVELANAREWIAKELINE